VWLSVHCILPRLPSYVARARMNGPGGFRGSGESREQTLTNGMYQSYLQDGIVTQHPGTKLVEKSVKYKLLCTYQSIPGTRHNDGTPLR
jgi:hypothetical protein